MATVTARQLFFWLAFVYPIIAAALVLLAVVVVARMFKTRQFGYRISAVSQTIALAVAALFFGYRGIIAFNMPYREELLLGRILALVLALALVAHCAVALVELVNTRKPPRPRAARLRMSAAARDEPDDEGDFRQFYARLSG